MGIDLTKHCDPTFVAVLDQELTDLANLPPNWDGYGAPWIDRAIIAAARQFVRSLPEHLVSRPKVMPMSPGNLQLEWHDGSKVLELEFEDPQTIHYLHWHPEACVEEEDTFPATDVEKANCVVRWLATELA